jgi:hypothetical protein
MHTTTPSQAWILNSNLRFQSTLHSQISSETTCPIPENHLLCILCDLSLEERRNCKSRLMATEPCTSTERRRRRSAVDYQTFPSLASEYRTPPPIHYYCALITDSIRTRLTNPNEVTGLPRPVTCKCHCSAAVFCLRGRFTPQDRVDHRYAYIYLGPLPQRPLQLMVSHVHLYQTTKTRTLFSSCLLGRNLQPARPYQYLLQLHRGGQIF